MFKDHLATIISRTDLNQTQMAEMMSEIFNGKTTDAQVGAMMAALATKGETVEELAGAARAMRKKAHRIQAAAMPVVFVIDEVITGFRLAPGGAQEYFGVVPDLACFAKAMANGMPVSAVAGKAECMNIMADLMITVTYGGEALSLAAAVATMKEIREKNVTDYLWHIGQYLMDGMDKAAEESGIPFKCDGLAPVHHMQFLDLEGDERSLAWLYFLQEMAARGVLFRRGSMNAMTFSHKERDMDEVVEKAAEVFRAMKPLWKSPDLARYINAKRGYE